MILFGPSLRRRDLLVGIGALATAQPRKAIACHERDHAPCHVAAFASVTGAMASIGQDAVAGIRAMAEYFRETDPQRRGHLGINIVDAASDPNIAGMEIRKLMLSGNPPAAIIMADFVLPPSAVARFGSEFKVPLVSLSAYPSDERAEWVCRLAPDATQIAGGMAGYLSTGSHPEGPVNFISTSATAGRANEIADALTKLGKKVTQRVTLDSSGQDVSALMAAIGNTERDSGWIVLAPIGRTVAIVDLLQNNQKEATIVIDAGIGDPTTILRETKASNVTVVSLFAPDLVDQRPVARTVEKSFEKDNGRPLTPAAALAATAAQVVAQAAITAQVRGNDYGEAVRAALLAVSISANELILPWDGIKFAPTFQNEGARVAALQLKNDRAATVWPTKLP